ncbi:class I SAM-dependent methyltransferase [Brassicibacter mesophilus]|uniref:class I SAM-dependent methyltransferase n=1 Tax=Brassicibacter mesophilus TaxID=745119 RepID=UPI003D1BCD91
MNIIENNRIKISEPINIAKKPKNLFEQNKSQEEFWDDEYISKQMLDAHLNPTLDAASRKRETIAETCKWISSKIGTIDNTKILDLGCGPGLYASILADLGLDLTGIDYSKRSIEYAKEEAIRNNQSIRYIYEDYLDMYYKDEFNAALMIYCDFGVLSNESRGVLLKKVHDALKKGGYFIFDVWTTNNKELTSIYKDWKIHDKGGFWSENSYIELVDKNYYEDEEISLKQHIIIEDSGDSKVYNLWEQCYTTEDITALLEQYGFEVISIYSDLTGKPYEATTEVMGLLVRKR